MYNHLTYYLDYFENDGFVYVYFSTDMTIGSRVAGQKVKKLIISLDHKNAEMYPLMDSNLYYET